MRILIFIALLAGLVWWLRRRFAPSPPLGPRPPVSSMTETEARDVLGLSPDATRDDVIAAHRKLMQKVHPDLGGTTYLARQLNEAKRVLLERR